MTYSFRPLSRIFSFAGLAAISMGLVLADADPDRITETFAGAGGRGPYFLAWRNFTPGTERVNRNGLRQYRQKDYLIDYASGTLAFTGPVSPGDSIEVEYLKGNAQANTAGAYVPTVRLMERG